MAQMAATQAVVSPAPEAASADAGTGAGGPGAPITPPEPKPKPRSPAHYLWAALIARIYEVFPLVCPLCAGQMRIIAFITERSEVTKILEHIGVAAQPPPSPRRAGHRFGMSAMRRIRGRVWTPSLTGIRQPKQHRTTRSISAQVGELAGKGRRLEIGRASCRERV